ncbi:hypothetical protein [Spirosoma sordidisoli]|uniref:Uncharacterized protein n=1 Tax=Spirosoma sordidisoli TaxID=2502893 RepID=A0A4Q2UP64_9BACT|nr:hypothetical protein [Spirosoma sordidisoli]RYC70662.1 hypothetical protein EQG79_00490 [Spirosoma sordidisoli]
MDKKGFVKKALVAATALAVSASTLHTPVPVQTLDAGTPSPEISHLHESVQILYRPVLQQRIPDAPKTRGDKSWAWWKEQLTRIKKGWTEPVTGKYICGYHYWYLNFVKIPRQDNQTKEITGWDAPFYRDNDDEIMSMMWRNRYRDLAGGASINAKNSVFAKPRTIGYTQMEFLGVDSYHFIFMAGRERYIGRGYPTEKPKLAERGWFKTLYTEHIHPFFKTWNGRALEVVVENQDDFAVGYFTGRSSYIVHNWIQYRLVPNEASAGVFKSMRLTKLTAVEAGLWTGDSLDNFYVENKDCLEGGDLKWGMMVIGGTSNAVINKSSNYKTIFFNPEAYKAKSHFTPKTKALLGFIDERTGRSRVDDALAHIMALRKQSEGSGEKYAKELVENPLTPQEAFEPSASFAYDQLKIKSQIGYVTSHGFDQLWMSGKIEYIRGSDNKKVEFIPDAPGTPEKLRGPWRINQAGLPNHKIPNLHVGAIDDVYKKAKPGQKLKKRDSRNCMIIYRQPTLLLGDNNDMPVALYYDKLPDMQATYHEFYKGMLLYDVQQTIYEYNTDAFPDWLRDRNQSHRLWWINDHTPGIEVKGGVKTELTALGYQYLASNRHHHITLVPLLESLLLWGSGENDDIGSAFHCLLYLLHATKDRSFTEQESEQLLAGYSEYIQLGRYTDQPDSYTRTPDADEFIRLPGYRNSYTNNTRQYA